MRRRAVGLLWNHRTGRARLSCRLVAAIALLAALALGFGRVTPLLRGELEVVLAGLLQPEEAAAAAPAVVFVVAQVVISVGSVYLAGRLVDRRAFRDFGLRVDRQWLLGLGFGLVLGAGLMSTVFLVELAAGWIVVTDTFRLVRPSFSFLPWLSWGLVTFVAIGATEELLTRGYLLTNLAEGLTWFDRLGRDGAVVVAVVVTSIVFGWGHLVNPNADAASAVGVTVAAVMLASGYVLTGELAIPIGVHVAWNFFQGPVFGFPVSGVDFGVSVVAVDQVGPRSLTGGAFGPEAGLVGVAASLLGLGAIAVWAQWREGSLSVHPSLTSPERLG